MAAREMPALAGPAVAGAEGGPGERGPRERALAAPMELNEAMERQRRRRGGVAAELGRFGFPRYAMSRTGVPRMRMLLP